MIPQGRKETPLSKHWIMRSKNTAINQVIDNPNCSFLGGLSCQPFTAYYVWEKFFIEYGYKIKRFIEFGVDQGNTACYFVLQCINYGSAYIGFDKNKKSVYQNTPVKRLLKLHTKIRYGNGYKRFDEIRELISNKGMTVIFTVA